LTIFEKGHILASFENYITFLRERFDESHIEEALESVAYRYAGDPIAMQSLIVGHLRYMWEKYLEPEWQIERQLLLSSVNAFQQIDLNAMDPLEAARLVTGQDLEDEKWKPFIERSDEIVFVPSAHIGPFLWRWGYQRKSYLMFGARQPAGMLHDAPDLSRAEIIVRLTALADDSRLRILRYLAENGEQRAQEIIQRLELSQSAVSRHLQQLTATGYISERRCDGGKCYRLNSERITDTLNAIGVYLDTSPEPPQPEIISVPRERRHQRL
jgi:DNA-binding transcriptional ArsR family regulator